MGINLLSYKSVCVVSGASRGIGRSMAVNIGAKLPTGSMVVILARDINGLAETKKMVTTANSGVSCVLQTFDQGSLDQSVFDTLFNKCIEGVNLAEFEQAMMFHNAGNLESELCINLHDVKTVANYLNINVTGMIALNAHFMRTFKDIPHKLVVTTSSLSAIKPMPSWGLYCTGKAARDMFVRNIAEEDSSYRVLNYAPGPVETHMYRNTALNETKHESHLKALKEMEKHVLLPDTTVNRLVGILESNTFENGAHVDYFDEQ